MTEHAPVSGVTVRFALSAAYDVEAIKRAAYRFSDRVSVEITQTADDQVCILRTLQHAPRELNLDHLANEFRNEVLDQDLRIKVGLETEGYRNLVLSLAFSKTPLGQ